MIRRTIRIPIYQFSVLMLEVEDSSDAIDVEKTLKRERVTDEIIEEICTSVKQDAIDGGWTISNFGMKRFIVVLLKTSSPGRRLEVLTHEKRHVEDDLLEYCGINDKEAAAYLSGFLSVITK